MISTLPVRSPLPKRDLDSVAARKQAHFAIRHRATSIVVGLEGNNHVFAVYQVFTHIFHLVGIHVGHRVGNGNGQVDNRLVLRRRLPNFQHLVANFHREFRFGTRKAFGGVFQRDFPLRFIGVFLAKLRAEFRDVDDFLFLPLKYLLSLRDGGGVVKMHRRPLRALNRFEGLRDDMLARLRQNLYGYVVGN